MQPFLHYSSVAVFSVFIGSQLTEGALLVPYWQSLPAADFYAYYGKFGPSIAQFYTVLTILAATLPLALTVYCRWIGARAFSSALIASGRALLFVASFYLYFQGANELFYRAALTEEALRQELHRWSTWHWGRIGIELAALVFLMLALAQLDREATS